MTVKELKMVIDLWQTDGIEKAMELFYNFQEMEDIENLNK